MTRCSLRRVASFALISLFVCAAARPAPMFDPIGNLQPVVLTGDRVPALIGTPGGEIWAYRYDAASAVFVQIPIQVDERAPYDLTRNIPGVWDPFFELTYDWPGIEDGVLDADDEIALMARDAGDRAPDTFVWVPGARDVRIELRIDEPLTGAAAYVYLFTSPTIVDIDPLFSYVRYTAADPVSGVAEVDTPLYVAGYEGRWRLTRLEVKPNPDLLDRVKARAFGIVGSETEETYEATSVLLGTRAGKVRALREVQGAASGVATTHLDLFYRDLWVRTVNLRVHPMPDIWYYWDYLPPSSPGRFFASTLSAGIPLDGGNDSPGGGPPPAWSQVSLPDGTLVFYWRELTPFPARDPACPSGSGRSFYWRDDVRFDDLTGDDSSAFGNHGLHMFCTGDTNTSAYSIRMTHYVLPPQATYLPVGQDYAGREENPLLLSAEAQTRSVLTGAHLYRVERTGAGRLSFSWTDALGEESYEIYRGTLWSPFTYGHDTAIACDLPAQTTTWTSTDDQETGQPSYYYLVVPRSGATRLYGTDGAGSPRPPASSPCP